MTKFKLSTFVIVGVVIFYSFLMLPLKQQASQDNSRRVHIRTERRIALVIGNSAYKESPLMNPVNDARAMARALSEMGFEVLPKEDLRQNEMKEAIREFGQKIRNGGVGLFYYAGHGIQVHGKNYLVPIGATVTTEHEVEYESVDVGLVLAQMHEAKTRLNIVILDACRNNPFARMFRSPNRGLASVNAPTGTLIAYATAPGSTASDGNSGNGLYTQELLKTMRLPSLKIEEVFKQVRIAVKDKTEGKQVPWESSSLTGDFFFKEESIGYTAWMSSEDYQNMFNNEVKKNNYPEKVEGRYLGGQYQFRALFSPYPEGRFVFESRHGVNRHLYEAINRKLVSEGYNQVSVQTFFDQEGEIRYQATWIKK